MAKIFVDAKQGVIEIEGDEQFVLTAYASVQSSLNSFDEPITPEPHTTGAPKVVADASTSKAKGQKTKSKSPAKPSGPSKSSGIAKYYDAKFDPNLDFSGLKDFMGTYNPATNMTRNLVFAAFLREKLGLSPCTADAIYSCYYSLKSELSIPEAFGKSLNDSRSEGFISYNGPSDITIPTVGENKLSEMSKAAAS